MKARILLVMTATDLAGSLSRLLEGEGLEVVSAPAVQACKDDFDLIVLYTLEVCDQLRRKGVDTSILMLAEDCVRGLKLGADDCVSRSCDSNELLARVEALLRRVKRMRRSPVTTLRFGDVEIDFGASEARKSGIAVSLTAKEFRLLRYLVDHRDRVVSRKEILSEVWEYEAAVSSRTIDVHVGWLRQKLEDHPQQPKYIKTIRGRGYRFDSDDCGPKSRFYASLLTSVNSLQ